MFNLEFEFWSHDLDGLGYCYYLSEYGECNRENAFAFYIEQLNILRAAAHPINVETEIHIGWITETEAAQIANAVDRVLVHYYRQNDYDIVNYGIDRLIDLAGAGGNIRVAPIFSSEGTDNTDDLPFMGDWLFTHPVDQAFESWYNQYSTLAGQWKENINILGAVWFTYGRFNQNHPNHITLQPDNQTVSKGQTTVFKQQVLLVEEWNLFERHKKHYRK
ncbi:hypothetical protein CHISP_3233 [Chitinispirillum alkaliphilum]|nr:hypothetical protein CHISP_3233 [Chitinispirillum alkaliphilum]